MSSAAELVEAWPPVDSVLLVRFRVTGDPKPAGSKDPVPLGRRNEAGVFVPYTREDGRPIVNMKDSSGVAGANWRTDVRAACSEALDVAHELVDGPLAVRVTFCTERVKSHFGTGKNAGVLKDSAPRFPHQSRLADGTKLARALEDALNKLCWTDDRRVVDLWWSRRFGRSGAVVDIFTLPAEAREQLVSDELSLLETAEDQSVIIPGDGHDHDIEALAV